MKYIKISRIFLIIIFIILICYLVSLKIVVPIYQFYEQKEEITNYFEHKSSKYIGVLSVPKIHLKKGLVNPLSTYNNVDYNLQIVSKNPLVIAGHSGNSNVSFFKDLYYLGFGDKAYIYYNNVSYCYVVNDKYILPKDGTIAYNPNKKINLILTTCYKHTRQLVVTFQRCYN